jgi:hypothetical protein
LAEVRHVEPDEEELVDCVAEENLGEGILAVSRVEEAIEGLLGEVEEFVTGKTRLELVDLILDPGQVLLTRGQIRRRHGLKRLWS